MVNQISGWWFGQFDYFPYVGNNDPNWLIQGGAPLVINWFINTINYSYITYKP